MVEEAYKASLALDNRKWNSATAKAGAAAKIFRRSVALATERVTGFSKRMAKGALGIAKYGAVAGAAAAVGMAALVKKFADAGDAIDKMSKRTGLAPEFLSKLDHAAQLSGNSMDDMEKAAKNLAKRAFDAAIGMKKPALAFKTLGVSATNAAGQMKGPEQLFREITDALAGVENFTLKSALASEIFGTKIGARLLPMLEGGTNELAKMMAETERLGNLWTTEASMAAANFNDSLLRMRAAVSGVAQKLAVGLMPSLSQGIDSITEWIAVNKDWINLRIADTIQDMTEWVRKGIKSWGGISGAVAKTTATFHAFVAGVRVAEAAVHSFVGGVIKGIEGIIWIGKKWVQAYARIAEALGFKKIGKGLRGIEESLAKTQETMKEMAELSFDKAIESWDKAKESTKKMHEAIADAERATKSFAKAEEKAANTAETATEKTKKAHVSLAKMLGDSEKKLTRIITGEIRKRKAQYESFAEKAKSVAERGRALAETFERRMFERRVGALPERERAAALGARARVIEQRAITAREAGQFGQSLRLLSRAMEIIREREQFIRPAGVVAPTARGPGGRPMGFREIPLAPEEARKVAAAETEAALVRLHGLMQETVTEEKALAQRQAASMQNLITELKKQAQEPKEQNFDIDFAVTNQGVGNLTPRDAKKIVDAVVRSFRQGVIPAEALAPGG